MSPPDAGMPPPDAGLPPPDAGMPPPDAGALDPDFAWYRLDETSGTIAHDSTPHHYDVPGLAGVVWGDGATFDGATVCGETTVGPAFREAPLTITAWLSPAARSDETVTHHALDPYPPNAVSGDVPTLGGFGVGVDVWVDGLPPGEPFEGVLTVESGINASTAYHSVVGTFTPPLRHFVALVEDTTSATVYVDGVVFAKVSADLPPAFSPTPLHLGCHNDDTAYLTKRFFAGTMRDVRIYTRLLMPAEIATLYADGPAP